MVSRKPLFYQSENPLFNQQRTPTANRKYAPFANHTKNSEEKRDREGERRQVLWALSRLKVDDLWPWVRGPNNRNECGRCPHKLRYLNATDTY